jgi:hypothetical protein
MPFVILPTNSASGGYDITNSLRFNAGSSDYLNRTPSSTTDRQKATLSFWTKYSDDTSGNVGRLFNFGLYPNGTLIYFGDGAYKGKLLIDSYVSTSATIGLVTTQLFRDYSAWYHIVVAFDTTQATASNRVKLYVNGTQVTTFDASVYPSQNENLFFNYSSSTYQIGKNHQPAYFSGYLAETYMIDGQQLTPSSFGETDFDTGIWKPKAFSGSFGTNGFYLQFKNSASLGTDSSGNGNTFTVNNLTSVDQSTDTPTNNFCTLNNLDGGTNGTFTEGNLQLATSSAGYSTTRASFGVSAGKWYWEAKLSSGTAADIGINTSSTDIANTNQFLGYPSTGYAYSTSGNKATNNTNTAYGSSYTTNDIIGVAFDADNGTLVFYKNGTTQGTAFTGLTGNTYHPAVSDDSGSSACTWQMNFGSPMYSANSYTDGAGYGNFSYAVPSGYYALNTKNLATYG